MSQQQVILDEKEAWPEVKDGRVHNFNAGPGPLPLRVLEQAQAELLNAANTGMSVLEMSHRSKAFMNILSKTEHDLREILEIPDNYSVLFFQGGATGQFSAIPLNMYHFGQSAEAKNDVTQVPTAHYIVSGVWSQKAAEEAEKYMNVKVIATSKASKFTQVPVVTDAAAIAAGPAPLYTYICPNETVHGVELNDIPEGVHPDSLLVADFSSSFCSRPIDVKRFAVIYAGAQKNVGPAGVTILIVRKNLLEPNIAARLTPTALSWALANDNQSMYNTPPCMSIYVCGLVFQWLKQVGGLKVLEEVNRRKAGVLYGTIIASNGFYHCPVKENARSRMNVVFRIAGGNEELEAKFAAEAAKEGLVGLAGHRSVGGMRASLYNAVSYASCVKLADFMKAFQTANETKKDQ